MVIPFKIWDLKIKRSCHFCMAWQASLGYESVKIGFRGTVPQPHLSQVLCSWHILMLLTAALLYTGPHETDFQNEMCQRKMIPFRNPQGLGTSKLSKSKSEIEGHWSKIFKKLLSYGQIPWKRPLVDNLSKWNLLSFES